jgi:uncharacterized membrane protein
MKRVLFLGEGSLHGSARYLAGILRWAKIPFDHVVDQEPIPAAWQKRHYGAFILSDYRHASFSSQTEKWLVKEVLHGSGLLMIGGWASFTGKVGHYAGSRIEQLLPVRCVPGDDRVQRASGAVVGETSQTTVHFPSPDFKSPPIVCGYHRVRVIPGSKVLLLLRDVEFKGNRAILGKPHPLLVAGHASWGSTLAFLTDCAPHWAGGLVDWGHKRITVTVSPGVQIEVGDTYLRFFADLIRWISLPG